MDCEYDLFTCSECGTSVWSHPAQDPPPTMCSTCWHLERYVDDPTLREELRRRDGIGPRWHRPRKAVGSPVREFP
jgi:hypothetical protein